MSALLETTFTNKTETRQIVDEVMQNAFEAVCSTMGPNGNFVVINQTNIPKVTKDGVSVAKALDFNENRRNMIAKIITEPSIKTDVEVGDGTTTTIFQTYHLYQTFKDRMTFKNIRYLDDLLSQVRGFISTLIQPGDIKDPNFRKMLLTSANYEEEIVNKIIEIYTNVEKPNVTLVRSLGLKKDEISLTKEIFFNGGFGNEAFVPPGGKAIDCGSMGASVVIVDDGINILNADVVNTISLASSSTPTILIARNFDLNAIRVIMDNNNALGRHAIIPFKLEAAGSLGTTLFEDLGTLLGVPVLFDIKSLKQEHVVKPGLSFWIAQKGIVIDKTDSIVAERAEKILVDLDYRYEQMNIVERQQVIGRHTYKRISLLRANNVAIHISGVTDSDMVERYYRYEDVMKSAATGLQYGVIPGIGFGYLKASEFVKTLPVQSDEGLEQLRLDLVELLTRQYTHLTDIHIGDENYGKFIDLVTGEMSDHPETVFDNAAAVMIALEGAWATAKTLGKLNNVMGRSNKSYA